MQIESDNPAEDDTRDVIPKIFVRAYLKADQFDCLTSIWHMTVANEVLQHLQQSKALISGNENIAMSEAIFNLRDMTRMDRGIEAVLLATSAFMKKGRGQSQEEFRLVNPDLAGSFFKGIESATPLFLPDFFESRISKVVSTSFSSGVLSSLVFWGFLLIRKCSPFPYQKTNGQTI